jgi:YHS domain-containing protein
MLSGSKRWVSVQKLLPQIFIIAVFATALISLNVCSNESYNPSTVGITEIAINGYDPVSYFKEGKPSRGTEEFEYVWNDAKYRFSCQENLELFKSNPTKYAPQYYGYCAFAMSRGDYSRIDPEAYLIVNDKLYLTYNRDIRSTWLYDKENYIKKADRIWQDSKFNKN